MGTLPYDGIGVEGLQLNKPQKIASPFILVSHLHQLLTYGHFQKFNGSTAVLLSGRHVRLLSSHTSPASRPERGRRTRL